MIRFMPDTWRDLLLRPIAMAAPDASVYVEIMAPDLRFVLAAALALLLAGLVLWRRRTGSQPTRGTLILAGAILAGMVPWMSTTANGRYFIPGLLAIGIVCIGLAWLMPLTRGARLAIAALVVALQGFVVQQGNPWGAWELAPWREAPYFDVEIPSELITREASYVTLSAISYSLVAPRFAPGSRWMSLANAPVADSHHPDAARAQAWLAAARPGRLYLFIPFIPGTSLPDGLPNQEVSRVIDEQLHSHRLALAQPQNCRLLHSRGLIGVALRPESRNNPDHTRQVGFWLCNVEHGTVAGAPPAEPTRFDDVFRGLEVACPRFFTGGIHTQRIPGGELRYYPASELKAYVMDDGAVFYKYYRAFSLVRIGTVDDVRSGKARVDCANIRGRSGLPWEREI